MPGFQPLSFKEASCSLKGNAGEGVAQVVQCLPNKHEALSSKPSKALAGPRTLTLTLSTMECTLLTQEEGQEDMLFFRNGACPF
jgi:hypothetical protein